MLTRFASERRAGRGLPGARTTLIALLAGSALAIPQSGDARPSDPHADLPPEIVLTGVVRDFRERTAQGGHPDFERQPTRGFGHYVGQVADQLDEDGNPVYLSGGRMLTSSFRDAQGRNRVPNKSYIDSRSGDVNGAMETQDGGSLTTAANFNQWFRDVPGVNMSAPLSIRLVRQPGSNVYVFDDRTDPLYMNRGGFFPINGELFGNSGGSTPTRNHHFTFELDTQFVYDEGAGQVFTFRGDDDVYVFIDGKLVIDLGGVHSAIEQTIELDRLGWLQDGERYTLKFFFAERHRTQSNFRVSTTINLQNAELPVTEALFD